MLSLPPPQLPTSPCTPSGPASKSLTEALPRNLDIRCSRLYAPPPLSRSRAPCPPNRTQHAHFKTPALNSLQLFPLRARPSGPGKHVALPLGGGRGASARGTPSHAPSPGCRAARAWTAPPPARHTRFPGSGRVMPRRAGAREVTGAAPQAPDSPQGRRPRSPPRPARRPAAPPSPQAASTRGRRPPPLVRFEGDSGGSCRKPAAAILVKGADAGPAARPPFWNRVPPAGSRSRLPSVLKSRRCPRADRCGRRGTGFERAACPETICSGLSGRFQGRHLGKGRRRSRLGPGGQSLCRPRAPGQCGF